MNNNRELNISVTLKTLGVKPALLGYDYLRYAISEVMDDKSLIHNITKRLYRAVANKFETTPSRVERAMRHAVEEAWLVNRLEDVIGIFGNTVSFNKDKPTNGEFIATVADYLLIHTKE